MSNSQNNRNTTSNSNNATANSNPPRDLEAGKLRAVLESYDPALKQPKPKK